MQRFDFYLSQKIPRRIVLLMTVYSVYVTFVMDLSKREHKILNLYAGFSIHVHYYCRFLDYYNLSAKIREELNVSFIRYRLDHILVQKSSVFHVFLLVDHADPLHPCGC